MNKRIVITGMGIVSPLGNQIEEFWKNIIDGKCGIGPITRFDTTTNETKIAGQVLDQDFTSLVPKLDLRRMDYFAKYANFAAKQALESSHLKIGEDVDSTRIGAIVGNGIGGFTTLEDAYYKHLENGRVPPLTIPKIIANMAAGYIAILNGIKGPTYAVTTACSSGGDAIINAINWIQLGLCDAVVTGGTEAAVTDFSITSFNALKALSTNNAHPQEASRPFDKDRDGFVMAEGSGIFVIEPLELALKRNAPILGEITGYGVSCDAFHMTAPDPEGSGAVQAMNMALNMANLKPTDIDYINAHGTSTQLNDKTETLAIKKLFGDHAYKLKVSSIKGHTGHTIGAAGAIEAITSLLALRDQIFPATIGLKNPDLEAGCDLDYVMGKAKEGKIERIMSNSLGFGGHNAVLILEKFRS